MFAPNFSHFHPKILQEFSNIFISVTLYRLYYYYYYY